MFYEFQHAGIGEYTKILFGSELDFPSHLHTCFELIVALSGEVEVVLDGNRYIIKEKNALLVFPKQIHSITDHSSKHLFLIFSPELVKTYTTQISGKIPKNNLFTPSSSLLEALCRLSEESPIIEKKGVLYTLCAEFDRRAEYVVRKNDSSNTLYAIFRFVEENYNKDPSLSTLSSSLGFSYTYLSRYFKKTVGISYKSYVNRFNISKACYLLDTTDMSIINCALECGYESLRSFNRNFFEAFNLTPSEYRNRKSGSK